MSRRPPLRLVLPAAVGLATVGFLAGRPSDPSYVQSRATVIGHAYDTARRIVPGAQASLERDSPWSCTLVNPHDGPWSSHVDLVLPNDGSAQQRLERQVWPVLEAAGWTRTRDSSPYWDEESAFSKDGYGIRIRMDAETVAITGTGPCVDDAPSLPDLSPSATPSVDLPIPTTPPGAPLTPVPGTSTRP